MTRDAILERYRHLRAISRHHHHAAMRFLSRQMILEQARRLGLREGRTVVAESELEMALVSDLALYTAPGGRTRALDRYARAAGLAPGSDEARVLDAMRAARFSMLRVGPRHATAGVTVTSLVDDAELWLMDEGMEKSASEGMAFAGRLLAVDAFVMTAGVMVPVSAELVEGTLLDLPPGQRDTPAQVLEDTRFQAVLYRNAIADGILEQVEYR